MYPRKWSWPKGEHVALSVGLAFEDFENESQYKTNVPFGKKNHFSLSFGDYGWKVVDKLGTHNPAKDLPGGLCSLRALFLIAIL